MNSAFVLVFTLAAYSVAYRVYGQFLKRQFAVNPELKTPAHEKEDGVDYVPAKNWLVLFGHHFSSICGAGPIIGPVLACAYWGWGVFRDLDCVRGYFDGGGQRFFFFDCQC